MGDAERCDRAAVGSSDGGVEEFEAWLCDAVAPTIDAMRTDPARALDAETVRARLRARQVGIDADD